jgi:hypothetical protein
LGDVQCLGGATEVTLLGDGDEVPHETQFEIGRGRQVRHA